jgi:hypothetical protein
MNDTAELSGISEEKIEDFLAYQEKVRDTNINEQTLLATDYLNHFNEIVMLLEMVPDMPEMLEDAKECLGFPANSSTSRQSTPG